MNLDQYQYLVEYLDSDKFPPNSTDLEQRTIIKWAKFYKLRDGLLYKKNRKDLEQLIRVIKWTEVEPIFYMMHNYPTGRHLGTDAMYYKIAERYY